MPRVPAPWTMGSRHLNNSFSALSRHLHHHHHQLVLWQIQVSTLRVYLRLLHFHLPLKHFHHHCCRRRHRRRHHHHHHHRYHHCIIISIIIKFIPTHHHRHQFISVLLQLRTLRYNISRVLLVFVPRASSYTALPLQFHHVALQLQLRLHLQLHLRYTTLHPAVVVRWPLQALQTIQQTKLQPPFGPFVDSFCHPWLAAANPSYRFPIFETSATALCSKLTVKNKCSLEKVRVTDGDKMERTNASWMGAKMENMGKIQKCNLGKGNMLNAPQMEATHQHGQGSKPCEGNKWTNGNMKFEKWNKNNNENWA